MARDVALAALVVLFVMVVLGVGVGLAFLALDVSRCNEIQREIGIETTYTLIDRCTVDLFGFRVPV